MKLDYNNYYSDREAEINNKNQGGNNNFEDDEYKSDDDNYDNREDNYEVVNVVEEGIKASYDEMINEGNRVELKDFLDDEYKKN
jgi:hypothetical protein